MESTVSTQKERFYRLFHTVKKEAVRVTGTKRGSKKPYKISYLGNLNGVNDYPRLGYSFGSVRDTRIYDNYEDLDYVKWEVDIAIRYGFKSVIKDCIIESCEEITTVTLEKDKDRNASTVRIETKKVKNYISLPKMIEATEAELIIETLKG